MDRLFAAKYLSPWGRALSAQERAVRAVSYALKNPTPEVLDIAAPKMAKLAKGPCWLVPIPASDGSISANFALALAIAELVPGAEVLCAVARAHPVESSTLRRKRGLPGLKPEQHAIICAVAPSPRLPVYFVDNVVTTGATIEAARAAIGWGVALTFSDASTCPISPCLGTQLQIPMDAGLPVRSPQTACLHEP